MSGGMDSAGVGATSVGVLLENAQRLAWDLLEQRRDVGSSTSSMSSRAAVVHSAGRVRAHAAAWPVLAAAGAHALRSAPVMDPAGRRRGELLAQLLDRLARRDVPVEARGAEGDVRMLTIARQLGAVGDLLDTAGCTPGRPSGRAPESAPESAGGDVGRDAARDALAVRDKVAAVLEVAAAASLGYADVATGLTTRTPGWGRLVEATCMQSRDLMVTAASERAGRFDDVAATAVAGDRDDRLAGVVSRWAQVSGAQLTPTAASHQALALVANDAAMVSRTAVRVLGAGMAAGVVDPAVGRPAVDAIEAAAVEWKATATRLLELRLGGRPDSEQLRASLDLGSRLRALGHDRTSLQDPRALAELGGEMRRAAGVCADLATRLEDTVCGAVSTGGFTIPAVVALRSVRPAPTEWLQPAARRGWVPARVDLPQVAALTGVVGRAAAAAQTADELTARTATISGGLGRHAHAAGAASLSPGYRQVPVSAVAHAEGDAEATQARDIAATGKQMTDQPGSSDRRADTRLATGHPRTPSPRQAPPHAPGRRA